MSFNVRLLDRNNRSDLEADFAAIGADHIGIKYMSPKGMFYCLRADGIRTPAANILKQDLLSRGGDVALNRQVIVAGVDKTSVVMMATVRQYQDLIVKLNRQQFGLPQLAVEIEEVLNNLQSQQQFIPCGAYTLPLGQKTLLMGILNVTPDSFSDGGKFFDPTAAIAHGIELMQAGADIIDIGGESTRPGFTPVSAKEEIQRVVPVIQGLVGKVNIPISIDTTKASVARAAIAAGATILNDVWGLQGDPEMVKVAAESHLPVIVMHNQHNTEYDNVIGDIMEFFRQSLVLGQAAGMSREQFILDPGIGFAKTVEQNLEVMRRLKEFKTLGLPLLMGTSKKSTIAKITNDNGTRLEGTAATVALSIAAGADIVRVHDVAAMLKVVQMSDAIIRGVKEVKANE